MSSRKMLGRATRGLRCLGAGRRSGACGFRPAGPGRGSQRAQRSHGQEGWELQQASCPRYKELRESCVQGCCRLGISGLTLRTELRNKSGRLEWSSSGSLCPGQMNGVCTSDSWLTGSNTPLKPWSLQSVIILASSVSEKLVGGEIQAD